MLNKFIISSTIENFSKLQGWIHGEGGGGSCGNKQTAAGRD